jgi:NIMA (never in mitosis gene a)-related kinase
MSQKDRIGILNEVRILASLEHPNIIAYKECFIDSSSACLCLVMELATEGDLRKLIEKHQDSEKPIEEEKIWKFATQMIKGLHYLHKTKIAHRDIKSANVLLTRGSKIKIGDMNVSKVCETKCLMTTMTGTPYYIAPEVWKGEQYDMKSDIWSIGVLIYELATLEHPFKGDSIPSLYNTV